MTNKNDKRLKNENYLGLILIILALMAFATIVKSCNIAQYQHYQQVETDDSERSG